MRKIFFTTTIALILIGFYSWNSLQSPLDPNGAFKSFVIPKGEVTNKIADRLEQEGFIRSATFFKIKLKLSGQAGQIQAGDFKLSPRMSLDEIIKTLSEGSIDRWVTLLEGWRVEEMAKELSDDLPAGKAGLGVQSEEFIKTAKKHEGYLFPDTYLFNPEATSDTIIKIMMDNFKKKYTDELQAKVRKLGLTPEAGVILASIVEREARSDDERQRVASILLKRLNIGMKLDADATVQYAKDSQALRVGNLDKFWKPISKDDYSSVKSIYNSYINPGLPPAPICNPGLSSLQAVANADPDTPYLYYYHDPKGNSHYATTLEEHNENVANNR